MILHFLYITCRKNSLFRGPGIEKAGRHTEKAAPGESAARIAEKTKRKNARRKAIGPLQSKVQATRRVPAKRDGGAPAGKCRWLCRGSGADNRAESTASGANTPFFHSEQLRVTLQG